MRKATKALALALSTVALGLGTATAASAGDYLQDGVRLRVTPYTSDTRVTGLGYRSQTISPICYDNGTSVNGNEWWTKHKNNSTGKIGFSSETLLARWASTHC
ncbi:hypothetical protein [Streptomyces sp. NBC_00091]|uniref:hypothetical protein n=1 Tax=Streptomyces sp. NBC_00091 TaxID=2975648 RepID=UPI00224D7DFB|nr:hypothetical protein [Streptomyces sp. NBC_00091]MCX5377328.1 hypothetical protein [Streptomyces sp. NBC_00091]